jgi:hypothetical protein
MVNERDVGQGAGGLQDEPFSFRAQKDGTVRIAFHGTVVTTLAGKEAARFLARVDADPGAAQLLMAKATGNFKRGNEQRPTRP